jgi:NitT/TauT family transport system ATP-binding protein
MANRTAEMTDTDLALSPPSAARPSAGSVLVTLMNVRKTFPNGTTALEGAELVVHDGEFLSLLGPSGCGKSTVLRLIAGLTKPSDGQIDWRDGVRPELGFVFQEPTLMPWSTVVANVWLPLRLRGISQAEAMPRIEATLALVGLSGFAHAYPRELSGGMKMRVSIARALVLQPAVLLMDEPFAALDEITRFKLNNDLLRLKAELGTTVVFVTHSVYESVYLSTRIAVFAARPGRIIETIEVPEPLPRHEDFRLGALYTDRCRQASAALHGAMSAEDHL